MKRTTVSVRLTPGELAELDAFRADLGSFGAHRIDVLRRGWLSALSDPSPGSRLSRGAAVRVALLGTMAGRLIRRSRAGKAKGRECPICGKRVAAGKVCACYGGDVCGHFVPRTDDERMCATCGWKEVEHAK